MHPLQAEIARLRRRACRLGWLQGVSRFAAVAVAAILLWAISDVLFRSHEKGIRVLGFVVVLSTILWSAWRFLVPLFAWRLTDIDVAKVVDRRLPAATNRVASALEFVQLASVNGGAASGGAAAIGVAGSPLLRQAVVAQTRESLADVKLDDVLDRRPTVQAASYAVAVLALAAVLLAMSPAEGKLALSRLANPTADLPWPPRHQLAFDPAISRLAQGDAFEIRVVDLGENLPDEVWIEFADFSADNATTENETPALDAADSRVSMQPQGSAMVARRENVQSGFWYRAVGGDDTQMPWHKLTVVEPPALSQCQLSVHPPGYTGWPAAPSPRAVRALVGSQVTLAATAIRPLAKAAVLLESGKRVPLVVDAAGVNVSLAAPTESTPAADAWTIDDSRYYQFELTARDGTQTSAARDERWEIQPIADLPPVVTIEQPVGVLYATPQARVRIRLTATDDLAVAEVKLARGLRRQNSPAGSPERVLETVASAGSKLSDQASLARWPREDRVGPVDVEWRVAQFGAAAGDTIEYEAIAVDQKQQTAQSPTGRILIVAREEFIERAIDQQVHLAEQLLRATDLARQTQRTLASLAIQARQSGTLVEDDTAALSALESEHRQVVRLLVEPTTGVAPLCEALLLDLANNEVELPDRNRRLQQIGNELRRLEREEIGPLDRAFAAVWTAVRASASTKDAVHVARLATAFADATTRHDRIVASLAQLHEALSRWDNVRRLSREIAEIQRIEQGAASRVADLARSTLGQRIEDLPADNRAELAQLVETQRDLRRRLDRAQSRMDKLLATLETEDAHAAGLVTDAIDFLIANPIGGQLSAAGDQIAANRLGQAAQSQAAAIAALGELLALLDNRAETDPERQAKRLAAAALELERLRKEFVPLAAELAIAAAIPDDAHRKSLASVLDLNAREQSRRFAKLSREIVRLDALPPAERVARAAAGLRSVGSAIAEQPATVPTSRKEIEQDLAAAAQLLAAHARQLAAERIRAELVALAEAAAGLLRRQEMLLAESKAFQQFATSATADAWRSATTDAIERQRALGEEAAQLAATAKVDAFVVQLRVAADEMGEAATLLAASRNLSQAADVQRRIVTRLRQIVAATAPANDAPLPEVTPPETTDAPANLPTPPTPEGKVHVVEELRLVRSMQAALNERTASFYARSGTANADESGKRELAALAAEQQRLAALFRNLFVDPNHPALQDAPADRTENKPPLVDDGPSPLGP